MTSLVTHPDTDGFIERFEAALCDNPTADLRQYLPAPEHPAFAPILIEMLRVDMEHRWGVPQHRVDHYLASFPILGHNPQLLEPLAFEEYRLRGRHGEVVTPQEYHDRYQVDTTRWRQRHPSSLTPWRAESARSLPAETVAGLVPGSTETAPSVMHASTLRWLQLAESIPELKEEFHGFRLSEELGRGAFSRVFLAEQTDLAQRRVVLKITNSSPYEAEQLARLQHTNIVPIYSLHQQQGLHAICMPYRGRQTLAHWMAERRKSGPTPGLTPGSASDQTGVPDAGPTLETVLDWMRQLAEALSHAHQRGVLHGDLKPANLLLADDGTPMILDFNLSPRAGDDGVATAILGGTLAYMAPEQLAVIRLGSGQVDGRADQFALGAIVAEIITGSPLFPRRTGNWSSVLDAADLDRRSVETEARQRLAGLVPASILSLLTRCLAFHPHDRYGTLEQLAVDLRRHAESRPLVYAADRNVRERFQKWYRRNPQLRSMTAVATLALILLSTTGLIAMRQAVRIARDEAHHGLQTLVESGPRYRTALTLPGLDEERDRAIASANQLLTQFDLDEPPAGSDVTRQWERLSPPEQIQWRTRWAELAYLVAQAERSNGTRDATSTERLLALVERAMRTIGRAQSPHPLSALHADLLDDLGRAEEATAERRAIDASPSNDPAHALWRGMQALQDRQWITAEQQLKIHRDVYPTDYSAWFLLGNAYVGQNDFAHAEACYDACLGLAPDVFYGSFQLGLLHLQTSEYAAAERDFSRVLKLRSNLSEAYANRAMARQGLEDWAGAEHDITAALQHGSQATRLYFWRAQCRAAQGKAREAAGDRALGLQLPPQDEASAVARGMARLAHDLPGAISDLQLALQWSPQSRVALRNLAFIYAEKLHDLPAAIDYLQRVTGNDPEDGESWSGLAVLQGRAQQWPEALASIHAAESLRLDAKSQFQLACAYARLVPHDGAYTERATRWLAAACRLDRRWIVDAPHDPDLAPVRATDAFQQVLQSAQILHANRAATADKPSLAPFASTTSP